MTTPEAERPSPAPLPEDGPPGVGRYAGIGCLMAIAGFFSGGMVAVFIGKVVSRATGCDPGQDLPACGWYWFMLIGGVVGAITLPALTLWRLRKSYIEPKNS